MTKKYRLSRWQEAKKWFWNLIRGAAARADERLNKQFIEARLDPQNLAHQHLLGRSLHQIADRAKPWQTHKVSDEAMTRLVEMLEEPMVPVRRKRWTW